MKKLITTSFCALLALSLCSAAAQASYFSVAGDSQYGVKTHKTFLDQRYYHIFHQRYDFSCGSAALASLLTYHYRRPVEEKAVIDAMYKAGDRAKIRKEGFSLLDMKNYLESIGLRANGYRQPLEKLQQVGIPAIVLINRKGYLHFVLVQGVTKDKVLIGDPALGKKIVSRKSFESMWQNRILFVIDDEIKQTHSSFNTAWAWHTKSMQSNSMPMPNGDLSAVTLFPSFSPGTFE